MSLRKYIESFLLRLFTRAAAYRLHFFSSILWWLALERLKSPKLISSSVKGPKRVVVLNAHPGRVDYEIALANGLLAHSFVSSKSFPKVIFNLYLKDVISDLDHRPRENIILRKKKECREHFSKILRWLKLLFRVDAFITFNLNYRADIQLGYATRSLDIKFICIQKEANRTQAALDSWSRHLESYIEKFPGELICVYNEQNAIAIRESGISCFARVVVTGCARIDLAHQIRFLPPSRRKSSILFFLIQKNGGGLPEDYKNAWGDFGFALTRFMLDLSRKCSDLNFVFRVKKGFEKDQLRGFEKELLGAGLHRQYQNVLISEEDDLSELLINSSAVIGLNSTTLYEALAAGIRVISPEALLDNLSQTEKYLHSFASVARCPKTFKELEECILEVSRETPVYGRKLNEIQKKYLKQKIGNPDGRSGFRLAETLNSLLYEKER